MRYFNSSKVDYKSFTSFLLLLLLVLFSNKSMAQIDNAAGIIGDSHSAFGFSYVGFSKSSFWGLSGKMNRAFYSDDPKESDNRVWSTQDGSTIDGELLTSNKVYLPTGETIVRRASLGVIYGKRIKPFYPYIKIGYGYYEELVEFEENGALSLIHVRVQDQFSEGIEIEGGSFFKINSWLMIQTGYSLSGLKYPSLEFGIHFIGAGQKERPFNKYNLVK
jgi:hypothetical protein